MFDKFGRYVHIETVGHMRVFRTGGLITVILSVEYPVYLALEILEKDYGQ